MIRPSIIRILFRREVRRLQKNPSALVMLGLLTAIAFLMAIGTQQAEQGDSVAEMSPVLIIADRYTDFVERLKTKVPNEQNVNFALRRNLLDKNGNLQAPRKWSLVELRNGEASGRVRVHVQYAEPTAESIRPFTLWFREELKAEFATHEWVDQVLMKRHDSFAAEANIASASLGDMMKTEILGTTLLLMVQFFCSCHLLVSFTAQDREQRTLHALALTKARLSEIMVAKGLFHFSLTIIGCTAVAGILEPIVLLNPLFWITVTLGSISTMCIGSCIATVAKNQAAAGMLALCYMMAGAMLFFLATKLPAFNALKAFTIENYSFSMLYFTLKNPTLVMFFRLLVPMTVITCGWMWAARKCFYRFGWK